MIKDVKTEEVLTKYGRGRHLRVNSSMRTLCGKSVYRLVLPGHSGEHWLRCGLCFPRHACESR